MQTIRELKNEELQSHFWSRVKEDQAQAQFKSTWLNKVTEEAKIEYVKKIDTTDKKQQFKHLFSVPLIVSDQKFLKRHKTFQTFTKNSFLEQYEVHLKRVKGMNNTISEKADYNEIITKTHNNKVQQEFLQSLKKHQGVVFDNCLWSDKYYSQILHQSRLNNLTEVLQRNKLRKKEELLQQFEHYFNQHNHDVNFKKNEQELVSDMSKLFTDIPKKNLLKPQSKKLQNLLQKTSRQSQQNDSHTRPCTQAKSHRFNQSKSSFFWNKSERQVTLHTEPSQKQQIQDQLQYIITEAVELQDSNKDLMKQISSFQTNEDQFRSRRMQNTREKLDKEKIMRTLNCRGQTAKNKFVKQRLLQEMKEND